MAEEINQTQNQQQAGQQAAQNNQQGQQTGGTPPTIDYTKLADIINGRTSAAEESALRGYFKQQGITGEEAAQAIAAFKAEKAKNTPDAAALQTQVTQAQAAALEAQMTNQAMVMASELGLDIKTVPYVMKLADLSAVAADGKINGDKLKEAIGKVLEDLPQLKVKTDTAAGGFRVGADNGGSTTGSGETLENRLRAAAGLKTK